MRSSSLSIWSHIRTGNQPRRTVHKTKVPAPTSRNSNWSPASQLLIKRTNRTLITLNNIFPFYLNSVRTIAGDMANIMRKSERARLTTSRLLGVRRLLVVVNIYITMPLPMTDIKPRTPMTKPRRACHRGFIGGNWYQWGSTKWSISGGTLSTTVWLPNPPPCAAHV